VSKERARRRAAREREAGIRAAARAAEAERRERREARRRAVRRVTGGFAGGRSGGRQTGILARRRRTQTSMLFTALLVVNILVWVVRPDWEARLAALVVSILVAPVLATLLFRR
jgi:hypothetical protein